MRHVTENDLRTVLAERGADGPGRPFHVAEIVKQGRRMRLRKRVAAGATLAGIAAVITGMFGIALPLIDRETTASQPSLRLPASVQMPERMEGALGILSLIHSEAHPFVGQRVRVTFRPTSDNTGRTIRCADPRDWVLVRTADGGSEFGRCGARTGAQGSGLDTQRFETSSGWVGEAQNIDIWVFPADAPVAEGPTGPQYGNCKVHDPKQGTCDGRFTAKTITTNPERLAAVVGRQPGLWSVGIYDKAEGD
ncbi:hypothetical protein GCM10023194_18510 [Planotetraspora phitsanulokensis]|uniref:Uncharacterized protein n=1 Tax=Planotetraspora phitsanulokensis TaxID=575192 RepID=A0A8J3XBM5_9ACTN|nr:hypothetical protein [Planotetraspora phitsanulokensis]GII35212.1 hypothetical protein Pph01_02150 [Planotetraspora phitsanulokensis]